MDTLRCIGGLDVKILPRTAKLDGIAAKTGPPPEQDIPLDIPKRTALYVEQVSVIDFWGCQSRNFLMNGQVLAGQLVASSGECGKHGQDCGLLRQVGVNPALLVILSQASSTAAALQHMLTNPDAISLGRPQHTVCRCHCVVDHRTDSKSTCCVRRHLGRACIACGLAYSQSCAMF